MLIFLPALFGAVVGASITLFFNMWKFHRDERAERCDELCAAVQAAATLGLDYWVTEYETSEKQIVAETKLQAAQNLLELLFEDFSIYIAAKTEADLSQVMSDFTKLITGGQYTELGRKPDLERAKSTGPMANRLSVNIRRSNRETLPFHGAVVSFHTNKRRTLDMPTHYCGSGS